MCVIPDTELLSVFQWAKVESLSVEVKERNSCSISKESKRKCSNSKWICLVNNLGFYLKDKSWLHLDWLIIHI